MFFFCRIQLGCQFQPFPICFRELHGRGRPILDLALILNWCDRCSDKIGSNPTKLVTAWKNWFYPKSGFHWLTKLEYHQYHTLSSEAIYPKCSQTVSSSWKRRRKKRSHISFITICLSDFSFYSYSLMYLDSDCFAEDSKAIWIKIWTKCKFSILKPKIEIGIKYLLTFCRFESNICQVFAKKKRVFLFHKPFPWMIAMQSGSQ